MAGGQGCRLQFAVHKAPQVIALVHVCVSACRVLRAEALKARGDAALLQGSTSAGSSAAGPDEFREAHAW